MRIFVAGATGVIGRRLVSLLVADGHDVTGMTRGEQRSQLLHALGARAVVCDVYDRPALAQALQAARPEVVVHQLTDLPDERARVRELADANSRMRREGTRNLLAAAEGCGAQRFVAQSVAWAVPGDGGAAVAEHEAAVLAAGGVVVRYGQLYGPGTYYEADLPAPPRVHVEDAARRTVPALDLPTGVLEVVDA